MNKKNIMPAILALGTLLISIKTFSQTIPVNEPDYSKPYGFAQFPASMSFSPESTGAIFQKTQGESVSVQFSEGLIFEGKIISEAVYDSLHSVVVRSSNYTGYCFTLTCRVLPGGEKEYSGRIISYQHGDYYEIKKHKNGYMLIKKGFYDLVNE